MGVKVRFGPVAAFFQVLFLILFAVFARYDQTADGSDPRNSERGKNGTNPDDNPITTFYPMFQDIHVMIFIGFGFLMTFLKRYGFSAVGLNLMVASFCIQWSLLIGGLLHFLDETKENRFPISIESLINADFAAASVLITFGALLGKTSPVQLLVVAFIEVAAFRVNEYIGQDVLQATDTGDSMYVHVFGAYFGLIISRIIYSDQTEKDEDNNESVYHSDLFSMIGTIFLWMYWPSFNAALVTGDRQHRAVINTYLSLVACVITTFTVQSRICNKKKFDMVHVQNATLAGGVAVGTCADLMLQPAGAITIGIIAGALSSVGFAYLTPRLNGKKFHDTCGVNNLHGMPGLLAGITGIIMAAVASESQYSYSLYEIYPGRAPVNGSSELTRIQSHLPDVVNGYGRSAGEQAGIQVAALLTTLVFALVSGGLTGLILRCNIWEAPTVTFDDSEWWNTPEDFLVNSKLISDNLERAASDRDILTDNEQQSYGST